MELKTGLSDNDETNKQANAIMIARTFALKNIHPSLKKISP
jgi:hypothetical protein